MPTPCQHTRPSMPSKSNAAPSMRAFYELGLRRHWDSDTYQALAANPCERARVSDYLEPSSRICCAPTTPTS